MVIIRPVAPGDLDQLVELVSHARVGLTTLPKDPGLIEQRIRDSLRAFDLLAGPRTHPAAPSPFLFVLEDVNTGRIAGTTGIVSKVGGFEPFYAYRVETAVHESETLNVKKQIKTLHLVAEHSGPCEIGSLFLGPEYRRGGNGRLLSLVRFVFMAEHPEHFDPTVIAELRGVIDPEGCSPFWEAIGKHFFEIDYPTADYQCAVDTKFIADLMPKHPIYIPMLPPEAQAVIGQVHENTAPALHLLEQEGFRFNGMVDIFEAGPVVECRREDIRTVRQSINLKVGEVSDPPAEAPDYIIAKSAGPFRATKAPLEISSSAAVRIGAATALALGVKVGDHLRIAPLKDHGTIVHSDEGT